MLLGSLLLVQRLNLPLAITERLKYLLALVLLHQFAYIVQIANMKKLKLVY